MATSRTTWKVPLALLLAGGGLFIAVAADVVYHGKLQQADGVIAPFLHTHSNYYLVLLAAGFSGLGEFWLLFPFALLVAGVLAWKRSWRRLLTWAVGLAGSPLLCGTLKNYFAIPRPARYTLYTFDEHAGFTFPSGHTMGVTITCGLLALLWMHAKPRSTRQRIGTAVAAGMMGILTAGALMYIGVHYLTDVLGGWSISIAWLGVIRWILPPALEAAPLPLASTAEAPAEPARA